MRITACLKQRFGEKSSNVNTCFTFSKNTRHSTLLLFAKKSLDKIGCFSLAVINNVLLKLLAFSLDELA